MKKIAFTLAAITILSVAFASSALAGPRPSSSSHSSHSSYSGRTTSSTYQRTTQYSTNRVYNTSSTRYTNYNVNYGTRFAQGYYYSGRNHNHWSYSCYDARYGCTCYYDPYCSSYYYWCVPDSCYYPVSYCPYGTYGPN